jgi:DNA invertase Pin-like site-specific DNA recombinase
MNHLRIPLVCPGQGIDTPDESPCDKFQLAVLMAAAAFKRGIIRERVRSRLAAAKARGVRLGQPAALTHRAKQVAALKARGLGVCAISRELSMPLSSVHKILRAAAGFVSASWSRSSSRVGFMGMCG